MLKKFSFIAAAALFLAFAITSCNHGGLDPDEPKGNTTFAVSHDQYTQWQPRDLVAVFDPITNQVRKFRVSTDGTSIVGDLSKGDFPIWAVYPYDAVTNWTEQENCEYHFSIVQQPDGEGLADRNSYVQACEGGDRTQTLVFEPKMTLVGVTVDASEIKHITLFDKNYKGFQLNAPGDEFKRATYYAAFPVGENKIRSQATHRSGRYVNSSSDYNTVGVAGKPDELGVVTSGDWQCAAMSNETVTLTDFDTFVDNGGLNGVIDASYIAMLKYMAASYLPKKDDKLVACKFRYWSYGTDGQWRQLSAVVYYPESAVNGDDLKGIVLANHYSISRNADCPTNTNDYHMIGAWMNYAVVIADGCGFGCDSANPQAYLDYDVTACGDINALLAAKNAMAQNVVHVADAKPFNIGYSQGAYSGMANEKYVAEHPELNLSFAQTILGGGPYNPAKVWEEYLTDKYPDALNFLPLTICSFVECNDISLAYSKVFKEPLASHVDDWILSKQYSLGEISNKIGATKVADILVDGFAAGSSSEFSALMGVAKKNSLTSGWTPQTTANFVISHSTEDNIVPYACCTEMKNFLSAQTCTSSFTDATGNHQSAANTWLVAVLTALNK